MQDLPNKLKRDTIVEALMEVQFEHSGVPEIVVGQLAGANQWAGYQNQRLPIADFPPALRDSDPNLRYQAIFQLARPFPGEIIKVGPRVLSVHLLSPYPGWSTFFQRVKEALVTLFEVCPSPVVSRVGLRYINALTPDHGIKSLWDLDFQFKVASDQPAEELTASYQFNTDANTRVKVTLASTGFVMGSFPPNSTAFVDVDVSTHSQMGQVTREELATWVDKAHQAEKSAFFALWPDNVLAQLREA